MKRRNFIAGGCAVALAPLAGAAASESPQEKVHPETGLSYEDMYWAAQSHINDLEQENAELRAHALILSARV